MVSEKDKQERAIEKAQRIIAEAEKKRSLSKKISGLEEFKDGSFEILKTEESVPNLAKHIVNQYRQNGRDDIEIYLDRLEIGIKHASKDVRESCIMTITFISNSISDVDDIDLSQNLLDILVNWLRGEDTNINGFGVVCKQIQDLGKKLLEGRKWKESEHLLVVLYQIQNGIIEKNSTIQGLVVKMQENLASKELLESLTEVYLEEFHPKQHDAESLLSYLGRRAVIYLLNRLMHSESKKERIALVKLIPYAGNIAVPVLADCLQKKPAWFVIRNVIFIISEIGDSSLFSIVRPHMSHSDIRVQQQVISCIAKFGGNRMKSRLLEALPIIHDEIKAQLVMELGQMEGEDIEQALIELLDKRYLFTDRTNDTLIRKIIISLKKFPSDDTMSAIEKVIIEYENKGDFESKTLAIAKESLTVIQPKIRHTKKTVNPDDDFVSFDEDPVDDQARRRNVREIEDKAFSLIEEDSLEDACKFLFNQVRILARDKDFNSAEYLRDKLLEINPMALNEVIEAGELIEQEKNSSITSHHITVWNELYETMTTEEFNSIYYAMQVQTYSNGEILVRGGETDPSLYFINTGYVSLMCKVGDDHVFLKRLKPGDIIGMSEFFSVSVWTVTLEAQTECQISVLGRERFNEVAEKNPGLDEKLERYCKRHNVVPELIEMSGSERREFPRYPVSVIVSSMLMDPYGNPGKRSFKGELFDISKGGLSFSINISSKDNARLLLGRQILSEIKLRKGETLRCRGAIVGVKYQDQLEDDFVVHVKFHTNLQQDNVMQVVNLVM